MAQNKKKTIQGLLVLIDRKTEVGLTRWVEELERRKIPSLVMIDGYSVNNNPDFIKGIIDKSFDVGGLYNDGAFWPETYDAMVSCLPSWLEIDEPSSKGPLEIQNIIAQYLNDKLSPLIGKTMSAFSGKYFSYDKNTLKIADDLEIPYILARGTEKERAVIYQPREFESTIISVSNVPSKKLGTGSLCDKSLESRKETPQDFKNLLFNLNADRIILVAQTHISGLRQEWWDVYMDFFDTGHIAWQTLDDFVVNPTILPFNEIPVNKRADYMPINLQKAKKIGKMV